MTTQNTSKNYILIPNYNGEKFILNTIANIKSYFKNFIILVVDDFSTDASVDLLTKASITVIQRAKNGGFAAAVNSGLKHCLENNAHIILVTNSDVHFSEHQAMLVIQSLPLIEEKNTAVLGYIEDQAVPLELKNGSDISGFFFALKAEYIAHIGFFDETFFMYGEEQDFFRRTLKKGYQIHQTGLTVGHATEGSSGQYGSKGRLRNSWLAIRNSIYLEFKNYDLIKTARKIASLFLIINKLYTPKNINDPSVKRLYRPGLILGNLFLILAIFWNLYRMTLGRVLYE